MTRKPAHVDLALEAAGVQICDLEHRYVVMRLLVQVALTELRRTQQRLRRAERYHAMDRLQIQQLMGLDDAHHHEVRGGL